MLCIFTELTPAFRAKYFAKLKQYVLKKTNKNRFSGHFAVTRSLIEGLQRLNLYSKVYYNPKTIPEGAHVHVLANLEVLKAAIELKKNGRIKTLTAGPNIVVLPSDNMPAITSEHINLYLVNSVWVRKLYAQNAPKLSTKLKIWPAGVNAQFWKSDAETSEREYIVFYIKNQPAELFQPFTNYCIANNFKTKTVIYGNYTLEEFKAVLEKAKLICVFSNSESQGIALIEAWAMNVPSLVWKGNGSFVYKNQIIECESAPYLTNECGLYFEKIPDFIENFNLLLRQNLQPRQYVLNNLTDEITTRLFLQLINFKP